MPKELTAEQRDIIVRSLADGNNFADAIKILSDSELIPKKGNKTFLSCIAKMNKSAKDKNQSQQQQVMDGYTKWLDQFLSDPATTGIDVAIELARIVQRANLDQLSTSAIISEIQQDNISENTRPIIAVAHRLVHSPQYKQIQDLANDIPEDKLNKFIAPWENDYLSIKGKQAMAKFFIYTSAMEPYEQDAFGKFYQQTISLDAIQDLRDIPNMSQHFKSEVNKKFNEFFKAQENKSVAELNVAFGSLKTLLAQSKEELLKYKTKDLCIDCAVYALCISVFPQVIEFASNPTAIHEILEWEAGKHSSVRSNIS